MKRSLAPGLALCILLAGSFVSAAEYFVDGTIGTARCDTYQPSTRACGGGTATAFSTFAGAVAVAGPGDVVTIRQGIYSERLLPVRSGTAGSPVTFRPYPGEAAILRGTASPAMIGLQDVSHIVIQGLRVEESRWVEAVRVTDVTLAGNTFLGTPATGTTGNVRFIGSDHNRIVDNVLDDGNDNLLLISSDYNLVEGNTIREGRHSVFSIRCSNWNIIRNNYFANSQQKIGEIYDCGDDTTAVPHAFDATKHNVFEENVFALTTTYYSTSGGNGIQYGAQEGIVRRNIFHHNNVGINLQIYSDESLYNHYNRIYHNVFYANECAGVAVRGGGIENVFKNNCLYGNRGIGGAGGDCFGDGPAQIVYRNPVDNFTFSYNSILHETPGEAVIAVEFGSGNTLDYHQSTYPAAFRYNTETVPGFQDAGGGNFRLRPDSPLIDAGGFLAFTSATGSGTALQLDDARYFHDGFGIEGVAGDEIQLEGDIVTARIVQVDYAGRILTLDRPLNWVEGQGVALAYSGGAPDIGAFEAAAAGDLDGDGRLTMADVLLLAHFLAGDLLSLAGADLMPDGTVNALDLLVLLQRISG